MGLSVSRIDNVFPRARGNQKSSGRRLPADFRSAIERDGRPLLKTGITVCQAKFSSRPASKWFKTPFATCASQGAGLTRDLERSVFDR